MSLAKLINRTVRKLRYLLFANPSLLDEIKNVILEQNNVSDCILHFEIIGIKKEFVINMMNELIELKLK